MEFIVFHFHCFFISSYFPISMILIIEVRGKRMIARHEFLVEIDDVIGHDQKSPFRLRRPLAVEMQLIETPDGTGIFRPL